MVRQPELFKPFDSAQLRQVTSVTCYLGMPATTLTLGSFGSLVGTEEAGRRPGREPVGRKPR